MKLSKIAIALVVGSALFSPMAALSEGLFSEANTVSVRENGEEYSCYAIERAGDYFKDNWSKKCEKAGYERVGYYGNNKQTEWDIQLNVKTYAGTFNCRDEELSGDYFKKGVFLACEKAGYHRNADYEPTHDDLLDARQDRLDNVNKIRAACIILSQGMGSDDPYIIDGCGEVGIGVDDTNLH